MRISVVIIFFALNFHGCFRLSASWVLLRRYFLSDSDSNQWPRGFKPLFALILTLVAHYFDMSLSPRCACTIQSDIMSIFECNRRRVFAKLSDQSKTLIFIEHLYLAFTNDSALGICAHIAPIWWLAQYHSWMPSSISEVLCTLTLDHLQVELSSTKWRKSFSNSSQSTVQRSMWVWRISRINWASLARSSSCWFAPQWSQWSSTSSIRSSAIFPAVLEELPSSNTWKIIAGSRAHCPSHSPMLQLSQATLRNGRKWRMKKSASFLCLAINRLSC